MSKAADAAVALEQAFMRAAPPSKNKRMSEDAWLKALNQFHAEAREIRRRHSLGFLARAKAAYLLQQKLIAAGIHADIVRKVVFSLILSAFSGEK
ncbi:MAG TPA: hypothetical protein VJ698_09240 [Noviherbaspirillum sp.]|uniref:hypothetical protein n=1 Tax=Noviherbaspirillum sp. TaxID=1926288 RepID=UPI002B471665|nr:hypothetical protein [Noviherbaspirillum sp.]HJV85650.1 hypothetical protein [Noviherbaspirillum sp.]